MNKAGQGPFSEFSKFVQIKVAIYAPTPTTPPTVPHRDNNNSSHHDDHPSNDDDEASFDLLFRSSG